MELVALARTTLFPFHAIGMLLVELVSKAKISVEHHLLVLAVARKLVDALPLVLVWIATHVSLWAPTSHQH